MCGLAGIVTKSPRKFDYSSFCTLGIANDTRGGDSCGVFIDGKYDYGTGKEKFFEYYFLTTDFFNKINKSSIAFVHCRKASSGAITRENAQPVIIKEGNEIKYVLMHNGTIHNYRELAKKYIPDVDIVRMTDSQVMAHIFYHSGYKALEEYIGGAVFVIADYREKEPKVLLFRGVSKKHKGDKEATEERPLYYCCYKQELVFSSIPSYLFAIRRYATVKSVKENRLLEFNGASLVLYEEHSRDNAYQVEEPLVRSYGAKSYYRDYFEDGVSYISINHLNNTYSSRGILLHGGIFLNRFGIITFNPKKPNLYFFRGIPLYNLASYDLLLKLCICSDLTIVDFAKKFENIIRFFSIDGIYYKNGLWYKATSPSTSVLLTGDFHPLTSTIHYSFRDGKKVGTHFQKYIEEDIQQRDIDFTKIEEECMLLMNSIMK